MVICDYAQCTDQVFVNLNCLIIAISIYHLLYILSFILNNITLISIFLFTEIRQITREIIDYNKRRLASAGRNH